MCFHKQEGLLFQKLKDSALVAQKATILSPPLTLTLFMHGTKDCGTLLPPGGNIWKVMRRLNPEVLIWPKHKTERAGLETCISETKLWVKRTINLERNLVITEFNHLNFQMRKLRFRDTLWLTWRYFRATASSSPIKCNFPFNPPL